MPDLAEHQPLARLLRLIRERESNVTRLPSDGGGPSLIVDLNGDNYPEVVFCNFIHNYSVYPTFPISAPERPSSRLRVVNDQNLSTFQPRNKRFPSYFG